MWGQKKKVEGPEHFRWSEAKASEIDSRHTIQSAGGLTPDQKRRLTDAVVTRLKSHPSLEEFLEGMPASAIRKLASDTRVKLVDLNGDGRPEIIAQANGLGPCGGTGNCIVWIFQWAPTGVKVLLDTLDHEAGFQVITVRPWSTNDFRDIVLGSHSSATTRNLVWYRYKDGAYRSWKCYLLSRVGEKGEPLSNPTISPESCSNTFTQKQ